MDFHLLGPCNPGLKARGYSAKRRSAAWGASER
jgi:hypothetical protein